MIIIINIIYYYIIVNYNYINCDCNITYSTYIDILIVLLVKVE